MTKLHLQPAYLDIIKAILKQWAPQAEIWAYGSRVSGCAHDASDLDLVVRNRPNPDQSFEHLLQLKQAFTDSDLPIIVDSMDWAYLPTSYREEILKKYVIIQG